MFKAVPWKRRGCCVGIYGENMGKLCQNANSKQQDLIENHMQKVLEGSKGKKKTMVYMDIIHDLISSQPFTCSREQTVSTRRHP